MCRRLQNSRGSLANPLNHVDRIIKTGTPNLGSPWAEDPAPYPLSNYIIQVEAFFEDMHAEISDHIDISISKLEDMLLYNKKFALDEFYDALNTAPCPTYESFGVLHFQYKTGTGEKNYQIKIDNIFVRSLYCSEGR